jgi:hypothetical protein
MPSESEWTRWEENLKGGTSLRLRAFLTSACSRGLSREVKSEHVDNLCDQCILYICVHLLQVQIVGNPQPGSIVVYTEVFAASPLALPSLDSALTSFTASPSKLLSQAFLGTYHISGAAAALLDSPAAPGQPPKPPPEPTVRLLA